MTRSTLILDAIATLLLASSLPAQRRAHTTPPATTESTRAFGRSLATDISIFDAVKQEKKLLPRTSPDYVTLQDNYTDTAAVINQLYNSLRADINANTGASEASIETAISACKSRGLLATYMKASQSRAVLPASAATCDLVKLAFVLASTHHTTAAQTTTLSYLDSLGWPKWDDLK